MENQDAVKFNDMVIYETENFVGAVPKIPHIPRLDGGHIAILEKTEKYDRANWKG